ncbi:hypothetical protein [Leeuwenhoekiella sp. ZYFB001]|uniref:hypothetical protein n=1 Tax=Leeuwenhoekiella sp. ZYFB001 TaxID=2719912 RepID=UPI001431CCCD|nr:hypothetical protein [Leeuwenhoekiella sp. ZYFB001]
MGKKNITAKDKFGNWLSSNSGMVTTVSIIATIIFGAGGYAVKVVKDIEIQDLKKECNSEIMQLEFQVQKQDLLIQSLKIKVTKDEPKNEK